MVAGNGKSFEIPMVTVLSELVVGRMVHVERFGLMLGRFKIFERLLDRACKLIISAAIAVASIPITSSPLHRPQIQKGDGVPIKKNV